MRSISGSSNWLFLCVLFSPLVPVPGAVLEQVAFASQQPSAVPAPRVVVEQLTIGSAGESAGVQQRARKRNAAEYDRIQAQSAELNSAKDQGKIKKLIFRLRELSAEREQIAEQIKKTAPRFASLQHPQPLDLGATRRMLDPGTALLSYSVGEDHTVLFVVQRDGSDPALSIFTVPVHTELQHRESKDEALRAAQLELAHRAVHRHRTASGRVAR